MAKQAFQPHAGHNVQVTDPRDGSEIRLVDGETYEASDPFVIGELERLRDSDFPVKQAEKPARKGSD